MEHVANYKVIQYKLKDHFPLQRLSSFGYQVHRNNATKEIIRTKRNDRIIINCNESREFLISYYYGYKFEGYARYRHKKYLRDLIVIGAIELIK